MAASEQRHTFHHFDDYVNVTVTRTPSVIIEWIGKVLDRFTGRPLVVGVGVQWTKYDPMRRRCINDNAPAEILQLCVGNECIIIQLGYLVNVPGELRNFLTDEQQTYRFVGFQNPHDARNLSASHHRLEIRQLRDVSDRLLRPMEDKVAALLGYQGENLDPEGDSCIVWSVNELNPDQIRHASLKAYVGYMLGRRARLWEEPQ